MPTLFPALSLNWIVSSNASVRLEKSTLLEESLPIPYSKKDIFLYTDTTGDTGLVQQPDKIVVRFTHTIYPYSF